MAKLFIKPVIVDSYPEGLSKGKDYEVISISSTNKVGCDVCIVIVNDDFDVRGYDITHFDLSSSYLGK